MKRFTFCIILISSLLSACGGGSSSSSERGEGDAFTGCQLDQKLFDKSEVFEPLAVTLSENQIPRSFSLEKYAPKRLSQGRQGSCTAWATAYAGVTILHAAAMGKNPDEIAYSPAFVYNQITRGRCTGTHIGSTLDFIAQIGLVDFEEFPYTDRTCATQPDASDIQEAKQNRIKGYNRLTKDDDDYKVDIQAIKQNIAQGAPVITGIPVGGTFYQMEGKKLWKPTREDYDALERSMDGHIVDDGGSSSFGGHALCIIGYDDDYEGGAFQIMNSWGEDWADRGLFWMRYEDFEYFCNKYYGEAYGLYPIPRQVNANYDFAASIGLLENQTQQYLPFKAKSGSTFQTTKSFPKGTRFKIAVNNSTACYTYVIGQETDGSSYVLFPYTEKHSPYCGITGGRLFPKDYSLELDDIGKKDVMAVIFSKNQLDYKSLNQKISQSAGSSYEEKIKNAVFGEVIADVKYTDGEKIGFTANSNGKNIVVVVFEINKG